MTLYSLPSLLVVILSFFIPINIAGRRILPHNNMRYFTSFSMTDLVFETWISEYEPFPFNHCLSHLVPLHFHLFYFLQALRIFNCIMTNTYSPQTYNNTSHSQLLTKPISKRSNITTRSNKKLYIHQRECISNQTRRIYFHRSCFQNSMSFFCQIIKFLPSLLFGTKRRERKFMHLEHFSQ